ncbi:MAG: phosphopentomutase [Gammaproteobacteria bacterium]|nr:phosphopentomutase [Gammaproteobacteria bacterium]
METGHSEAERRILILVFDSLGIGASSDAQNYGDQGANTLGRIVDACANGEADVDGLRQGPLHIPFLKQFGLLHALAASDDRYPSPVENATATWGFAEEKSVGKDTPSGHWELAGVPVMEEWGIFPQSSPCFPEALISNLVAEAELPGILGNCHASGTEIIERLGVEHIRSGQPICYTSADSVFQIAAHEQHFGLERLYDVCDIAKQLTSGLNIARVIARPFTGDSPDNFKRTSNRRDITTPPPADTLLDKIIAAGGQVISIGKIADIFAHRGISYGVKGADNMALFDQLLEQMAVATSGTLLFVNFVDFDTLYGHRRDIPGYAAALEAIDKRMPEFMSDLRPGDLALITADHGCDPGWPGSDHTREHVPAIFLSKAGEPRTLGKLEGFDKMGSILEEHLAVT